MGSDPSATPPKIVKRENKRRLIVEAAVRVLMRDGLKGCTARAVADESPLTKSAIHYYFDSTDEIVDAAMEAHLDGFLQRLLDVATSHTDPTERFWAVVQTYWATFYEAEGSAVVWLAYWLQNMELGRRHHNERIQDRIVGVLSQSLADAGMNEPTARSQALFSYLIGTVLRQEVYPIPFAQVRAEVAKLVGLGETGHTSARNMAS
jgi:AcrR family transcriptional regulator